MSEVKRKRPKVLVGVLVAALFGTPGSGRAGAMGGGATEWTQIANNIQLVLQYVQQIIDYAVQIQQMSEMAKMTALFKDPRNVLAIASMFTNLLTGLNSVVFSGKSLADQWRYTHPGDKEPTAAGYRSISEAYKAIDKDLNRAAEQSLRALDIYLDPTTVMKEQAILDGLQLKMQTADGQARLAQVANELLFEVIRQLTLIRQVLQVQARMTAEDISAESQQRLYKREQKARDYSYHGRYRSDVLDPWNLSTLPSGAGNPWN